MRKWAFLVAATVAVIGCGGGGSSKKSSTDSGGGTGTPTPSLAVNLNPSFGTVDFTYLTGQGRRAEGDLYAVVSRLQVQDAFGQVRTVLPDRKQLLLNAYDLAITPLDIPFTSQSFRLFEQFELEFTGFKIEGADGSLLSLTPPASTTFKTRLRVLPGRTVSLPIFLDDAMFSVDDSGNVIFSEDQFRIRNDIEGSTDAINGFFSDYVAFDLTSMADEDRPLLSTGQRAKKLFLSGDNYAISWYDGATEVGSTSRLFEVLTLNASEPIQGVYGPAGSIGGSATPGTYTLLQSNPLDLSGLQKITALAGSWRNYTTAFSNFSTFEFILFPTSREELPDGTNGNGLQPDEDQEVLAVTRNAGGQITQIYYGFADLDTKTFDIFPVRNLVTAETTGEITGSLSGYVTAAGSATASFDRVRRGNYTVTDGTGIPSSGTFTVYRK